MKKAKNEGTFCPGGHLTGTLDSARTPNDRVVLCKHCDPKRLVNRCIQGDISRVTHHYKINQRVLFISIINFERNVHGDVNADARYCAKALFFCTKCRHHLFPLLGAVTLL